jgi:Lrp/AsnC family leucine-responsive transcriptional regulator
LHKFAINTAECAEIRQIMTLDSFDHRILDRLQDDCTLTHSALGDAVGLSGSAVRRRIQAMREAGVIAREVALLGDVQGGITVLVTCAFERESPAIYDAFRTQMRADPCVLQCYATAGQYDFMLIVAAESPEAYETWGERALMSNPDLRRYDSFVVWSTVKFTTKRPIGGASG